MNAKLRFKSGVQFMCLKSKWQNVERSRNSSSINKLDARSHLSFVLLLQATWPSFCYTETPKWELRKFLNYSSNYILGLHTKRWTSTLSMILSPITAKVYKICFQLYLHFSPVHFHSHFFLLQLPPYSSPMYYLLDKILLIFKSQCLVLYMPPASVMHVYIAFLR